MNQRLDQILTEKGLVKSRSQANDFIRRGLVYLNSKIVADPSVIVNVDSKIKLKKRVSFVSRAGEKLNSVITEFDINFKAKTVLDVGSSTGGFTEVALKSGAKKVIAVEVGTNQMHPSLRADPRVELHEKTDIREFETDEKIDIIVIDVSFLSLREIMPSVAGFASLQTKIVAMCKPQFEAVEKQKNKGVIKNDKIRRQILKDFEVWLKNNNFIIQAKRDSGLAGSKGNLERFYLLKSIR